jgi:sporulation protein YlmC with PRC-barrel domain
MRVLLAGGWLLAAAAPSPSSVPASSPVPPAPAHVEHLGKARAESLLGQPVTNAKAETIGHVVDVLIDDTGAPHAAVVEFTGFFGIGDRRVAVDWKALKFQVQQDHIAISTNLDEAALKTMPEYKPAATTVPVATPAPAPQAKPK